MIRRLAICVLAAAVCGVLAGSARPAGGAPTGLHAFLLRADEPARTSFARTPSFAWNPVPGADHYEFQLSLSDAFRDNAIVYADGSLKNPVDAPPIALPWISGNPHSLYARVRAVVNGVATPWSASYGFDMAPPTPPTPLPSYPGLLRWTPVEGAVKYEIWFPDANNEHVFTTTNVLDEREFYAFHQTQNWMGTIRWRIRAWRADPTPDHGINNLPATKWGAWSPVYSSTNPAFQGGPIKLLGTVSDVFSDGSDGSPAHRLMPAFLWSGNQTAAGKPAELYRVYVFTDRQCLNPVYASPAVASPAYAPRPFGSIAMPTSDAGIQAARNTYLQPGSEPAAKTFAGDDITINEFQAPAAPTTAVPGSPGASAGSASAPAGTPVSFPDQVGAPIDIWDTDWPRSGYYWTVIPVAVQSPDQLSTSVTGAVVGGAADVPVASTQGFKVGDVVSIGVSPNIDTLPILSVNGTSITLAGKLTHPHFPGEPVTRSTGAYEYRDLEMAQDVCASGRVSRFGKDSEPSLTASNDLFATGLSSNGRLTSAVHTTKFYGQPLVSWTPALGAWDYEIQWSKTTTPFTAVGSQMTKATSFVLPVTPGTWYYRVRGFDFSLPSGSQQMSWSDPAKLVVSKPVFKIVGGAPKAKQPAPAARKKAGTPATKRISATGFTIDVPSTWQRYTDPSAPTAVAYRDRTHTVSVEIDSTTISYQQTAAAILSTFEAAGVKATSSDVTLPAGKAVYVSAAVKGKYDLGYVVEATPNTWVLGIHLPTGAYAKNRALIGRIVASFRLR
jgi:hypothetical protein